jgi:hypothetical protein
MASLDRNLRRDLENAVKKARRVAEAGARQAIEQLAVGHHEPWSALSPDLRKLRNRLRAHGRQLGDKLDEKKDTQTIDRLAGECAYEHWHRLLFARFLAENDLLVEPESGMALSLDECRELARERGVDWLVLASDFAQRMLPQIFRPGDPVLELSLPPEKRQELEELLEGISREVFQADDSLGWVYQFWQAETKSVVNKSGERIDADTISAVTQLFTEDYMVRFLLENSLGAWWVHRNGVRDLPCEMPYLRLLDDGRPAVRDFDRWPLRAADIRLLDPCCGSGHFLVRAFEMLVRLRMAESSLSATEACNAVLSENLFGLEIDPRCTQIATFALALAAWTFPNAGGVRPLPVPHVACCGTRPESKVGDWLALAGDDRELRAGMQYLYDLFQDAPLLGSFIDPSRVGFTGDQRALGAAHFGRVQPLLEKALSSESESERVTRDESASELAVAARGIVRATEVLSQKFTLIATNVPYLLRAKQGPELQTFCESYCATGSADLATVFLYRCSELLSTGGAVATVTPQNWLFLKSYATFRRQLMSEHAVPLVARVGSGATATASWDVLRALTILTKHRPDVNTAVAAVDAISPDEAGRARELATNPVSVGLQREIVDTPEARLAVQGSAGRAETLLEKYASSHNGLTTGDVPRMSVFFWEVHERRDVWIRMQGTTSSVVAFGGREALFRWSGGNMPRAEIPGAFMRGENCWGKTGVVVTQTRALPVTLYTGEAFDVNTAVLIARADEDLPAIWAYCSSPEFNRDVRELDSAIKVTAGTLNKVRFDLDRWRREARSLLPQGLPKPQSDDPTQWVFDGIIAGSQNPLQVAVGRLVGYRWPEQAPDNLDDLVDTDGIVCLPAVRDERPAAERILQLLARALGGSWSNQKLSELLAGVGCADWALQRWLGERFFKQHCELFKHRPFVWHVWDGVPGGFAALVNYHKLAAPNGEGRRILEKLIFAYLGDWIDRQRADQKRAVRGRGRARRRRRAPEARAREDPRGRAALRHLRPLEAAA